MGLIRANLYFILSLILFTPILATSQTNELTKAIKLFDNGNFAEAEPLFKSALNEKPADFMINYFYGACRTENGHFSLADLNYLLKASEEVSPVNINYYLGMQYQAQNNWEQALKSYNHFKATATEQEQLKAKLALRIQQCYDHENPFTVTPTDDVPVIAVSDTLSAGGSNSIRIAKPTSDTIFSEPSTSDSVTVTMAGTTQLSQDTLFESSVKTDTLNRPDSSVFISETQKPMQETPINFQINNQITYKQLSSFKTEKGKNLFEKADSLQKELVTILQNADKLRERYGIETNRQEKKLIGESILLLENKSFPMKNEITQLLITAQSTERKYWQNASKDEIENFIAKMKNTDKSAQTDNLEMEDKVVSSDTVPLVDLRILWGTQRSESVKTEPVTDELIYKIQIGAYSHGLPFYVKRLFKKLSLIRKIENYTDEKGVVVYTTGNLLNLEDAIKMQNQVRQEGVEDAYVVPYFKGKRITLAQAKKLAVEE